MKPFNNKKSARILIDARFLGVGESMSRYIMEIIGGIVKLDKENEYTLLIRPQGRKLAKQLLSVAGSQQSAAKTANGKPQTANLKIEILDIPHYSVAEQTKLLKYLNNKKYDLVHFIQFNHPIKYKGKFIVTIHDLTLLGHLHRMGTAKKVGFNVVMKSAVKNSAAVITVSNTTKDDVVDIYKADPKKITPIYLAVDDKYSESIKSDKLRIQKFKQKYGIAGDYLLYTGMWKRHKNLMRMLKAFEKVSSQQSAVSGDDHKPRTANHLQLVFVGKPDKKEPEVTEEIERINNSLKAKSYQLTAILTTGFIDEEELPTAYAGALAYCFPSLSEGFGLTSLEAMACGTPVISSNASCMPEIYGEAAYYFDPLNVDEIADAMHKISTDEKLRAELSKKGTLQVKKYDWSKSAQETFEVYKKALNS